MKVRIMLLALLALGVVVFPAFAQDGTANTVQFNGVGFSFDSSLATGVNISQYPGDPTDAQQPGGPEPRYTQFNLYSQPPAPESFFDAPVSVRVYRIADMSTYGESLLPVGALQDLLASRVDLSSYMMVTNPGGDPPLPFLPVAPASQVIRARAQYIDAPSISGISYITAYRQDASPFVNSEFFYTFQGISSDGVYYVSAILRFTTADFPTEIPADFDYEGFIAGMPDYLTETVTTLNNAAPASFIPALSALDALVQTFTFGTGDVGVEPPVVEPTATIGDPSLGGLANVVWSLVSYGPAEAPIPALEGVPVTATFSTQGVAGSAGCNSYSGPFAYDSGTISFGQLISTLIACQEDVMNQETAYLAALASASSYMIADGTLLINYDGGVLTFAGAVPTT